mmetsp:Transcript_37462/g.116510  ORF Transcript_37462/g.116510 Transcript_37462/m.116510 type:complete len:207 (+) Transcript_37462:343-963(+)
MELKSPRMTRGSEEYPQKASTREHRILPCSRWMACSPVMPTWSRWVQKQKKRPPSPCCSSVQVTIRAQPAPGYMDPGSSGLLESQRVSCRTTQRRAARKKSGLASPNPPGSRPMPTKAYSGAKAAARKLSWPGSTSCMPMTSASAQRRKATTASRRSPDQLSAGSFSSVSIRTLNVRTRRGMAGAAVEAICRPLDKRGAARASASP